MIYNMPVKPQHKLRFQTVDKPIFSQLWGVVRGETPLYLNMRFSWACTTKTAHIKGWREERRANESPCFQAKTLEKRFRLEACRLYRHAETPAKAGAFFAVKQRKTLFFTIIFVLFPGRRGR